MINDDADGMFNDLTFAESFADLLPLLFPSVPSLDVSPKSRHGTRTPN
jgi:hypothetical protein